MIKIGEMLQLSKILDKLLIARFKDDRSGILDPVDGTLTPQKIATIQFYLLGQTITSGGQVLGYPYLNDLNTGNYAPQGDYVEGADNASYTQSGTTLTIRWPSHGQIVNTPVVIYGDPNSINGDQITSIASVVDADHITVVSISSYTGIGNINITTGKLKIPVGSRVRRIDVTGQIVVSPPATGTYVRAGILSSVATFASRSGFRTTPQGVIAGQSIVASIMGRRVPVVSLFLKDLIYPNLTHDITGTASVISGSWVQFDLYSA